MQKLEQVPNEALLKIVTGVMFAAMYAVMGHIIGIEVELAVIGGSLFAQSLK